MAGVLKIFASSDGTPSGAERVSLELNGSGGLVLTREAAGSGGLLGEHVSGNLTVTFPVAADAAAALRKGRADYVADPSRGYDAYDITPTPGSALDPERMDLAEGVAGSRVDHLKVYAGGNDMVLPHSVLEDIVDGIGSAGALDQLGI